jgi:hypothetical protein
LLKKPEKCSVDSENQLSDPVFAVLSHSFTDKFLLQSSPNISPEKKSNYQWDYKEQSKQNDLKEYVRGQSM